MPHRHNVVEEDEVRCSRRRNQGGVGHQWRAQCSHTQSQRTTEHLHATDAPQYVDQCGGRIASHAHSMPTRAHTVCRYGALQLMQAQSLWERPNTHRRSSPPPRVTDLCRRLGDGGVGDGGGGGV